MTQDQKIVATGAASGVATMLAALFFLSSRLPALAADADAGARLAYAMQWNVIAVLPLFFAIVAVGNARFKSEAIDPTLGKESQAMIIDGRVADNSLQQFALFTTGILAVAAGASGEQMSVVAAAAIIFAVMRVAFWIGYRIKPVYRAFGMAGTSYLGIALFLYAAWLAWT